MESVDRISLLLTALGEGGAMTCGALAAATGLPAATCSRMLKALLARGWVDQERNRAAYRLGPRLFALAEARPYQERLLRAAAEPMRDLVADHPGSGAVLVGLRPWQRFAIWGCGAGHGEHGGVDLHQPVGVWSVPSGRLLVAMQDARSRGRWLDHLGLPRGDEWPEVVDRGEVLQALSGLRRSGYAMVCRGGLVSAAVAIDEGAGAWVALGCHHPGDTAAPWLRPALLDLRARVTAALGGN